MKREKIRHYRTSAALLAALESRAFDGEALHLVVLHGPTCGRFGCHCSPEFVLEPLTVANVERGQREQPSG